MAESERTLIGKGGMGRAFMVSSPDGESRVEKEFVCGHSQELMYRLCYFRPHPYSPKNPNFPFALNAALQRRHMASLLSKVSSSSVEVLDAEPLLNTNSRKIGLEMPFIEGRPVTHEDKHVLSELDRMSDFFQEMGLTDWNLRGLSKWFGWGILKFIRGGENFQIIPSGKTFVVDNEEGYPVPNKLWGGIRFDDTDYPTLKQGLKINREKIIQRIGEEGLSKFEAASQVERKYWESFRDWEGSPPYRMQLVARALKPAYLFETINWLCETEQISPQKAGSLREKVQALPPNYFPEKFKKLAPHLVIHNLTHLLPIPPPLDTPKHIISSGLRATYTLGARAVENLTGEKQKKHTLLVAISSLIPGIGSFAYLIDLIPTESPDLTRLALDSISYHGFHTFTDKLVDLAGRRGFSRKTVKTMEGILNRVAFLKQVLKKATEEQFGKEITRTVIEDIATKYIVAAKSEPSITDEFPTQVCLDGISYLISWGNKKVVALDQEDGKARKLSRKQAQGIIQLLRDDSLASCENLEKVLTTR